VSTRTDWVLDTNGNLFQRFPFTRTDGVLDTNIKRWGVLYSLELTMICGVSASDLACLQGKLNSIDNLVKLLFSQPRQQLKLSIN